mgnify:CR=1 FL=1
MKMRVVIAVIRRVKFPEHFGNGKSHPQIDQVAFVIEKILQGKQRVDTNQPVLFFFPKGISFKFEILGWKTGTLFVGVVVEFRNFCTGLI